MISALALVASVVVPLLMQERQEWARAGIDLETPQIIRISEFELDDPEDPNKEGLFRTKVYIQLAFTSLGVNQKVETLKDMEIVIQQVGGDQAPRRLYARSFGELELIRKSVDATGRGDNSNDVTKVLTPVYKYQADAGVLTVAPNGARTPMVYFGYQEDQRFFGTRTFDEGKRYRISLTVERTSVPTSPFGRADEEPEPFKECMTTLAPTGQKIERMDLRESPVLLRVTDSTEGACGRRETTTMSPNGAQYQYGNDTTTSN